MKKLIINVEINFTDEQFERLGYGSVEEAVKEIEGYYQCITDCTVVKNDIRVESTVEK